MKNVRMAHLGLISWLAALPVLAAAPEGQYTVLQNTVRDNKTGLVWQRESSSAKYNLWDAQSYCAKLTLGGYSSGWRLPTKLELETLVDRRAAFGVRIDRTAFLVTSSDGYWSATPVATSTEQMWVVDFGGGGELRGSSTALYWARCVR